MLISVIKNARDSFAKTLRLATTLFIIFGLMAVLVYAVLSWRQTRDELRANLAIQASFAAASSQDFFEKIGTSLFFLSRYLLGDNTHSLSREKIHDVLMDFQKQHPEVVSMVIFLPDGRMLANTLLPDHAPLPNLQRHPEFLHSLQADLQSTAPYDIGRTLKGLVVGHCRIPVRRVIRDSQNRPLYVIQASILVKRQAQLWRAIPLLPGTSIGLLRDDGYHQSRWPEEGSNSLYIKQVKGPLVQAIKHHPAKGFYEGRVQSDGSTRLGAYTRIPQLRMTAYVSVPLSLLWSHWLERNILVFVGFVAYFIIFMTIARIITRREESHSQALLCQARRDPLTGLPNRLAAEETLNQEILLAQREDQPLALLFFDLDGFKDINDSLGHALGDQVLQATAQRLRSCLRQSDSLSRLGGDEFLAILPSTCAMKAPIVAEKILKSFAAPLLLQDRHLQIGTSIGISMFPDDGPDSGTLLRNADTAMYAAKRQGRNHVSFFAQSLSEYSRQRLELGQDLQRALLDKEFVLHFQPLIDLHSQQIIGAEALIRWEDPRQGLRFPAEFIPYAEESGLILPMGEWVLENACRQAKHWAEQGMELIMTANLSTRQFQDPSLIDKLQQILEQTRLAPRHLELEITETATMLDPEASIRTMNALKELGLQMAIDDFGTGYSSLSYLKRIPADIIKIDQSFVRDLASDPDDAAIVRAIIGLAKTLGRQCLAEGIESAEHFRILRHLGCDYGQGYFFNRPVPAEDFEALFLNRSMLGSSA